MSTRLLKAADYRRKPWKNGGGETVEIAVFPQKATVADFDWRVSMATVASDGPFSSFPGIDRTLSILEGDGLALDVEGRPPIVLTASDTPLAFPADAATSATLLGGSITDLNVMTRRGAFAHSVRKRRIAGAQPLESRAQTMIVFCHKGSVVLTEGGGEARLSALDTAIVTAPENVMLTSDTHADVFIAEITAGPLVD